jgi:NAD(P)-dependent dehydrogenase (short-subunit alcohol dehydrogenase family)
VNNAAIIFSDPIFDTSIERWSEVLAVNLTAPFLLIKSVGRHMIEHGNGGNIVNVVSAAAFRAVRTGGAYGVSKAGLASLTRAASWELGQFGINVNAVAPGVTATEGAAEWFGGADALQQSVMSGPYANLLQRSSEPMDVSNTVAFLCSPLSRQITAQVIHVSAGSVV